MEAQNQRQYHSPTSMIPVHVHTQHRPCSLCTYQSVCVCVSVCGATLVVCSSHFFFSSLLPPQATLVAGRGTHNVPRTGCRAHDPLHTRCCCFCIGRTRTLCSLPVRCASRAADWPDGPCDASPYFGALCSTQASDVPGWTLHDLRRQSPSAPTTPSKRCRAPSGHLF